MPVPIFQITVGFTAVTQKKSQVVEETAVSKTSSLFFRVLVAGHDYFDHIGRYLGKDTSLGKDERGMYLLRFEDGYVEYFLPTLLREVLDIEDWDPYGEVTSAE